jgi:hypothetical protein
VWFIGEGRQRGRYFLDAGSDVGGGGTGVAAAVRVAGVGAGDGVAEGAFDPGQGGCRSQWVLICWTATQGRCWPMRAQRWS